MLEQFLKLWPVLEGSQGIVSALLAWRGFIGVTVPIFNAKLQSKFTELLVDSPTIANSIVQNKRYQAVAIVLKLTIGILLPTESSVIVHQVSKQATQQGDTSTFDKCEIKPPIQNP